MFVFEVQQSRALALQGAIKMPSLMTGQPVFGETHQGVVEVQSSENLSPGIHVFSEGAYSGVGGGERSSEALGGSERR